MAATVKDVLRNPWVKFAFGCVLIPATLALLIWGLYLTKDIVTFIIISVVIAYVLNPVVTRLEGFRIPRWLSSPVLVGGLMAVLLLGLFLIVWDVQKQVGQALAKGSAQEQPAAEAGSDQKPAEPPPANGGAESDEKQPPDARPDESGEAEPPPDALDGEPEPQVDQRTADAAGEPQPSQKPKEGDGQAGAGEQEISPDTKEWIDKQVEKLVQHLPTRFRPMARKLAERIYELLAPRLQQLVEGVGGVIAQTARSIGNVVAAIFLFALSLVLAVYMLIHAPTLHSLMVSMLPAAYKIDILRMAGEIDTNVRGFIRGQLLVALSLAAIYILGLTILGVPYAAPIGVLGGLGNLIPYVGTAIGILLAEIASLIEHGFDVHLLLVLGVFAFGQAMEAMVITPKLVGGSVKMNPVAIIISVLVFGKLFGFFGALFAVPMASVIKVLGGELLQRVQQPSDIELPPSAAANPPAQRAKEKPNRGRPAK